MTPQPASDEKSADECPVGWHLRVTTFRGVVWNAVHWMANLRRDDDGYEGEIEIRRPLTAAEIKANPTEWEGYRPGDDTIRFDSKEALMAAAHACFLAEAEPGDVLYDCSPIFVERSVVLRKADA